MEGYHTHDATISLMRDAGYHSHNVLAVAVLGGYFLYLAFLRTIICSARSWSRLVQLDLRLLPSANYGLNATPLEDSETLAVEDLDMYTNHGHQKCIIIFWVTEICKTSPS